MKLSVSRTEQQEVTREEYNDYVGAEYPPEPELPVCAEHVWGWWWELNDQRPAGFDSLAPFSYVELLAWQTLTRCQPDPVEIRWLLTMDSAWRNAIANEREAMRERDKEQAEKKVIVPPSRGRRR